MDATQKVKRDLRLALQKQRRSMLPQQRLVSTAAINEQLSRFLASYQPKICCLYAATAFEINLDGLFANLLHLGWQVAFPKVSLPVSQGIMAFYATKSLEDLQPGYGGIPEPMARGAALMPAQGSVIIVPALALDPRGNRLGYGGGFYDRYLAAHPQALTIGIVPEACLLATVPTAEHDIKMNYIATEQGCLPAAAS